MKAKKKKNNLKNTVNALLWVLAHVPAVTVVKQSKLKRQKMFLVRMFWLKII